MATRRQGSVQPRGEKRWLIRWFDGLGEDGRRVYRSEIVAGTKRDAQAALNAKLSAKDLGAYVVPNRLTFGELCDRFYETMETTRAISERTLTLYRGLVEKHARPVLEKQRVAGIRQQPDVQAVISGMGARAGREYSTFTIETLVTGLRRVFAYARRAGIIAESPMRGLELPAPDQEHVHVFTRAEIQGFRKAAAGDRFEALYDFLLVTGCRPGEALALRWADLDLEFRRVTIRRTLTRDKKGRYFARDGTKTRSRRDPSHGIRSIPLPAETCMALVGHRKRQREQAARAPGLYDLAGDLVFATEAGTPLNIDHVRKRYFAPICTAAGITGATMYSLRHTCATRLLEAGHSPKVIAERLGNSPEMVLRTYTRATQSMQDAATAELTKLLYA